MKAKKCKLIIHGQFKQIDMGEFSSISQARQYVRDCNITGPYTIQPLTT